MSEIEFHLGDESRELSGDALEEVRRGSYKQKSDEFVDDVGSFGLGIPKMAFYQEGDILNSALVAAGEKRGMMLRATLPDREPLQRQIDALNQMGLDCFVVPETVDVEGQIMDNSALYVTNSREYRGRDESNLPFTDGKHEDDRGLGEFFGYPVSEVDAFVENGVWPKGFSYESGEGRPIDYEPGTDHVFPPPMIARERGADEETLNKLQCLLNYAVRDNPEAINEAIKTAESRYETLLEIEKEYGVEFTDLI